MRLWKLLRLVPVLALLVIAHGASAILPPVSGNGTAGRAASEWVQATDDLCPPLPAPSGPIIHVSSVSELRDAVSGATAGTTILVADGTYHLDGAYLRFDTPGVTMRSASGDREAVVLDGDYVTTEIVQIVASNVTVANLTLREAYYHPIHVTSSEGGDTTGTLITNVHIVDPREQAIKINPDAEGYHPDYGEIACSHIELTDAGRPHVNPTAGGCYTGGIDAHQARGWRIHDNLIAGFWCPNGLSEHGIHLWRGSRDTVVERNVLRNNARGIGFGLATSGDGRSYPDDPCPGASGYVDHYGGVIRNNVVFANDGDLFGSLYGFDCGICLWNACGARVLHNTVASTQPPFSAIEWRYPNTDPEVINNLVTRNLMARDGAVASESGNLVESPLSLFVDGSGGDLHLAPGAAGAIDQVAAPLDVVDDLDGDPRPIGAASDVGADEYGVPPPAAVTDLRVILGLVEGGTLTATLRWTAPADAVIYTLRHAAAPLIDATWHEAAAIPVPFAATPGSSERLTASVSYSGGTVYFALRSQNGAGGWSDLSNNAFWPGKDVTLPLVLRAH
jgi:hypothetical protein